MARWGSTRTTRTLVFVAVVAFTFWRPLFAGGTLAPDDQVWSAAPFGADAPAGLTIEVAEPDAIGVHSAWVRWGVEARDGSLTQLGDGRSGAPTLADGVPFTHVVYALVPAWYAPGLVAALAMLLAMGGTARFLDRLAVSPSAATVGGLAYGLSGLVFVWIGWPHATAFAIVPWVLAASVDVAAAVDRRTIVRLAGWVAALAWCGVWAITAYALVGVVATLASVTRRSRAPLAVAVGVVTGLAVAAPHLLASWSRWQWAEPALPAAADDSSAAVSSVLTLGLGSLWGADAVGYPWIAASSAQLSVAAVGLVIVALAMAVLVVPGDRRLPLVLGVVGFGVAYVGGPFVWLSRLVAGEGAELTHARVLLVLGVVVAAAQTLSRVERGDRTPRPDRVAVGLGLVLAGVAGWSLLDWIDVAGDAGAVRTALAESTISLLALATVVTVVESWRRQALAGEAVVIAAGALVVLEALSFGMAIPSVTDRDERLAATPTHTELFELVGDQGLIVGEGRAMPPVVAARFGPDDVRVPRPRSAEEIALLTAADADAVRGGASTDQPIVGPLDVNDPVWRRFGVDAFVTAPGRRPPGIVTRPLTEAAGRVDPAGAVFTTPVELDAGLRAIEIDLQAPFATPVEIDVTAGGRFLFGDAVVVTGSPVLVPIEGDGLDGPASVTIRVGADAATATIGVDDTGLALVGVIGSDESETCVVDGLTIVHRPVAAVTDAAGADVVVEHVDDRSLRFSIDSERPVDIATDIVDRPGWSVTVDGGARHRTPATLIGVGVPAGTSEVELRYRPPGLLAGALVIVATALGWVLVGAVAPARRSPDDEVAAGSVPSRD
ncbi:MAG: YfhO family protein [Actinomycetota bacterium]